MQPILRSSVLTVVVLVVLFALRSINMESQRVVHQFFILVSIAMATIILGYWAIQYLASILGSKKAKRKRDIFLER